MADARASISSDNVTDRTNSVCLRDGRRAVEIDPKFAMAYAYLGIMYGTMGETGLAVENVSKASQLRDRTSEPEKFFVTAYYYGRAIGNQEKA